MMKIGCLGISANPPHLGHIECARILLASHRVDEVWLVPVFEHPFDKLDVAPWHHRLAMTRLLEEPGIVVSRVEEELVGKSYTIQTLRHLNKTRPELMFYWCAGSDIVTSRSYLDWKNWNKLEKKFRFLIVERPSYSLDGWHVPDCFEIIGSTSGDPMSSTAIRNMIAKGKDIVPFVGEDVARYIKKHKLY